MIFRASWIQSTDVRADHQQVFFQGVNVSLDLGMTTSTFDITVPDVDEDSNFNLFIRTIAANGTFADSVTLSGTLTDPTPVIPAIGLSLAFISR